MLVLGVPTSAVIRVDAQAPPLPMPQRVSLCSSLSSWFPVDMNNHYHGQHHCSPFFCTPLLSVNHLCSQLTMPALITSDLHCHKSNIYEPLGVLYAAYFARHCAAARSPSYGQRQVSSTRIFGVASRVFQAKQAPLRHRVSQVVHFRAQTDARWYTHRVKPC